jgi:hypothetical protein
MGGKIKKINHPGVFMANIVDRVSLGSTNQVRAAAELLPSVLRAAKADPAARLLKERVQIW